MPQLRAAAADDAMAEAMLDAGIEQLSANPPALPRSPSVLTLIANPDRAAPTRPRRLEKLLKLHRLDLEQNAVALVYREIADTLRRLGQYAEAAATVEQMIAKYPGREDRSRTLAILAEYHRRAGHVEAAKAHARRGHEARRQRRRVPAPARRSCSRDSARSTTPSASSATLRQGRARITRIFELTLGDRC